MRIDFIEKKAILFTTCFFLFSLLAQAQVKLTGVVKDEKGTAMQGVNVSEKGTTNVVATKENGTFSISVTNNSSVLVFSFVGYTTREVPVGLQTYLNIIFEPAAKGLDDIVVVGYGTQKKINATGAVSTVTTKTLTQSPVANISNSLVGRMPGLFATQAGGEPGNDASKIRIRGVGTFSGNTDPLTLVDGIEVSNYNNIDPNEIESVTILKDASSTAVYGIRGANGVLIITTRRGKTGPPKISYTFNEGFNSFVDLRKPMNSADYATNYNTAMRADAYVTGAAYVPKYSPRDIELYRNGTDPIFHPNSNWSDLLFRKTSTQMQHNISINGGQKKVRYFISGGYFNQQGLFKDLKEVVSDFDPQSTYRRFNIRSNFNFEITDRLKLALDASSQTEIRTGNNQTNTERVVGDILKAASLDGPGVVDGKIVNISPSNSNPYAALLYPNLQGGIRRGYRNYINGSLRADYDLGQITKGLSVHGFVAVQNYNDQTTVNQKTVITYLAYRLPDSSINYVPSATSREFSFSQTGTYNRRITAQAGLDYKRIFGDHSVTGMLVYNQKKTYDPSFAFLVPKGYQNAAARATYDFKTRYLAEVNIAYTGTENFAPGKQFGWFPAYSLGWVVSNESFFPAKNIIGFLKFRASYGEIGNDIIGGNRFLYNPTSYNTIGSVYYFGNIGTNVTAYNGLREGATGNPNVTWERKVAKNLGMELYLLKGNKLRITADAFKENRNNILAIPQTISLISGLIQPATNLGRMENYGYEGDVQYNNNIGKLQYRVGGNISFARNKVIYRDEIPNTYAYQNRTGQRLGQFFTLIADGIYNTWEEVNDSKRPVYSFNNNKVQPGDLIYRDVNGDGIINDFDQVPMGYSNTPEITYGASFSANYAGFDASILFQGVGNASLYYLARQRSTGFGGPIPEGTADYFSESWTQERYEAGLPIKFPRFNVSGSPNSQFSSFYLADASYLRIKNVEIGYSPKSNLLGRAGISSCRIYANANNLFTWKHTFKGVDPENTASNPSDTNSEPYPLVRTINLGINLNF